MPIMSLQTGGELARVSSLVIDPGNLHIVALELSGDTLDSDPSFLRVDEIREVSTLGAIVDSSDDFVELDDVISLEKVYGYEFNLLGMDVIDDQKQKVGKVINAVFNPQHFIIQQLNVKQPFFKSLGRTEVIIHRKQIVEINDNNIVVKAPTNKISDNIKPIQKKHATPFSQGQADDLQPGL